MKSNEPSDVFDIFPIFVSTLNFQISVNLDDPEQVNIICRLIAYLAKQYIFEFEIRSHLSRSFFFLHNSFIYDRLSEPYISIRSTTIDHRKMKVSCEKKSVAQYVVERL